MKKRILIVLSVILLVLLSVYTVKKVKSELLKRDIANSIKDFLNEGKYCKYFGNYQLDWLETVKRGNVNNYEITEFVNYFIETSKRSIETRLGMNNEKEYAAYKKIVQTQYKDISIVSLCYWYYKYFANYITENDIELYKNNKLEEKIKNELKNKLDYKDGKWYIGGNKNKQIDLLYGFYLNYIPDNRVEKIKPKKILDIKILNKYLHKISYNEDKSIDVLIKYIDLEDNIIECNNKISIHVRDKEHLNVESLSILYYEYPGEWKLSQLEIHHYSKDKEDEEYREWERANIKAEEERDPSTIEVDEQSMEIEMFKKYKQYAEIIISIYEDGSINSYFRKCESIVAENGKKKVVYMERELPYKNKPLLEVMKLYVNDKEQNTIDEELLKGNKPLVEYRIY